MSVIQRFKQDLKNDLIAGLLVVIPLATTIWLSFTIASWAIAFLTRIPKQINPFNEFPPILGDFLNLVVGFTAPLALILLIGLMARNIAGRWLLDVGERLLQAIPLAGAVYKTLKQLLETLLRDTNDKFRRVVLVEYPRRGVWAIAFVTSAFAADPAGPLAGKMLSLFIPTTPNPTTGWYAIVPETEVVNLAMSVEDAFKVVVSGGIVGPNVASALPSGGLPPGNPPTGNLSKSGLNPGNVGTSPYGDRPASVKDGRSLDLVLEEPLLEPPFESGSSEIKRQSMPLPPDPDGLS
ncbi:MAG: hypothetical protein Fur0046_03280 [Cyanobacteria bacterium J069]|nr:MAG: DUF502 domain-containing protein [Cyanobacteria bacterium J069]